MAKKQTKQNRTALSHWYQKRWIHIGGGFALFILLVLVAFRVSPVPGALIIRSVFDSGGEKTLKALEAHTPKKSIQVVSDQQYKPGDKAAQLDVYYPAEVQATDKRLPTVVWTHGGAWLSGSKNDGAPYFKLLAAEGFTVVAPNYSLSPGTTYPTPVHQLNAAHAYILENAEKFHIDSSKIFLAGDSAGAQLSAQLAALITNRSYAEEVGVSPSLKADQLKGTILNCGIYKMEELAHPAGPIPKIVGWGDDVTVWAYSGTRDFEGALIRQMSPYYHVTSRFPATFITGGNGDPLTKVQSIPLADKLESLNVDTTKLFYEDNHQPALPHEYQFNLDTKDGQNALQQILNFVRQKSE